LAIAEARFQGGDVTYTAKANGATEIAFGPPGSPADIVVPAAKSDATIAQRVNRALDGMAAAFRPVGPGGSLKLVSVDDARLAVVDEKSGARWSSDDAKFAMERDKTALSMSASASLKGAEGAAPFSAQIKTDTRFQSAALAVTIANARPQALLPSLGGLRSLTTPITLKVDAGLDRKAGITRLDGDAQLGAGALNSGGGTLQISGGRLAGRYDLAADTLYVSELNVSGAKTSVKGAAKLTHASAIFAEKPSATPARFEINAPRIDFEMPGAFAGPVSIEKVVAAGTLRPDASAVEIETFQAGIETARLTVAGRLYWGDDGAGKVRLGAALDGKVDGVVTPQTVVRYWPMNLGPYSRQWCEESLLGGRLTNATLKLAFSPRDLAKGPLDDDKLALNFDFDQAKVLYIPGMPAMTNVAGHGELRGNSLRGTINTAAIGELALNKGKVTLSRLHPVGAPAVYEGHVVGSAKNVVKLLLQAPIGLAARLPFDAESIAGAGEADFQIRRPLGGGIPADATEFSVDGQFEKVGATAKNGDYTISNWSLRVRGDDKALVFAGPLALGRSSANMTWTERVRAKTDPSLVVLNGKLTADDLISLGFPILKYASGPVGVEARSTGVGLDVNKADVKLDFTNAAINLERGFWKKNVGAPSTVEFAVARQPDRSLVMNNVRARGGDINVAGTVQVSDVGDLLKADLTQMHLPGTADGKVMARRDEAGVLQVAMNGSFLNIGAFFAPEPSKAPSADQMLVTARTYEQRTALSPAYEINASIDKLRFRGDADISKAKLNFVWDGKALRQFSAVGGDLQAKPFELSVVPGPKPGVGKVTMKSEDAGLAARAFLGLDNVKGGKVEADGLWTFGENPSATFRLKAKTFLIAKVPAMAHLLSSVASLTGLVEALNGQGITFSDLDAPITMANGKLTFAECRASGPSLGITAKGGADLNSGAIDIDGVLVPSYGLNSFLGNLPILGNMLTSRKGEGVFGITYTARGPAENPRVAVNPLSAITPGILRRIFERTPSPALRAEGGPNAALERAR
jgi:hypothetical protein